MVSEDKQYEYLGGVINSRLEYTRDALKLYINAFTLIVGGSIWLNQEVITDAARDRYVALSNLLVWLLFAVTGVMVFEALRSWYQYRKAICLLNVGDRPIPAPKIPILGAETTMIAVMLGSAILFTFNNPFTY